MRCSVRRTAIQLASCALVVLVMGSTAFADRRYTVETNDTLADIARRFRTTVYALKRRNRLNSARIRPGLVLDIPARGVVYVRPGDTLSGIARTHKVPIDALRRHNRLRRGATLREGQQLRLPGVAEERRAERRWGTPRKPGFVDVMRLHTRERVRMTVTDRRGRVRRAAIRRIGRLMTSHRGPTRARRPHRRLLAVLARVSDHFGGRRITIVSGFRSPGGFTRATSKHTQGRAIDFRIRGVPNTVLRDYCKRLSRVGVGYYPRSTFVHLDVRDRSAYWVDWSRPGQAPQYERRSGRPPSETSDGEPATTQNEAAEPAEAADPPAQPPSRTEEQGTTTEAESAQRRSTQGTNS